VCGEKRWGSTLNIVIQRAVVFDAKIAVKFNGVPRPAERRLGMTAGSGKCAEEIDAGYSPMERPPPPASSL
jgi:hypothetical protein